MRLATALTVVLVAFAPAPVVSHADAQTYRVAAPRVYVPPDDPRPYVDGQPAAPSVTRGGDLRITTAPKLGDDCLINFNDPDALALLPDFAWDTFVSSPWWMQFCNPLHQTLVRPVTNSLYHLSYDDPNIGLCFVNGHIGRWDHSTCKEIDPLTEPRYLSTHEAGQIIHLYVWDSTNQDKRLFDVKSIRIRDSEPVRFCYKPYNADPGPWEANAVEPGTGPGLWYCWDQLDPGHWDLSAWVYFVTEVKMTATNEAASHFAIDDIVLRSN